MEIFMTFLDLIWRFFVIGLTTFGGGYAMMPLMQSFLVDSNPSYISLDMFLDFIAISESTPGPFAVNMATFIGNHAIMILPGANPFLAVIGGIVCTIAVVLPSFLVILSICILGVKLKNSKQLNLSLRTYLFIFSILFLIAMVLKILITDFANNSLFLLFSFIAALLITLLIYLIVQIQKIKKLGGAFNGLRPAVLGLLASVGITLLVTAVFPIASGNIWDFNINTFDWKGLLIIFIVVIFYFFNKRGKKPIYIILLSAFLGIMLYGWF